MKVLLVLVDGMRPDALAKCKNPFIKKILKDSLFTLDANTVFPSVTLPCHMSLFHSVDPTRHGITTNIFTPQVRPINGLFEQLRFKGKRSAMFFNWNELRDLSRPGNLVVSSYVSGYDIGYEKSNEIVANQSIDAIKNYNLDFCFTYLGLVDHVGHEKGWMSDEYYAAIDSSFELIKKIMDNLSDEYITIIISDHGGHDCTHGTTLKEDMTIPVIINGKNVEKKEISQAVSIKDIAPTIVKILNCDKAIEWEGESII